MTKTKQVKLPDKPSALIRLALRDLEKCEQSKNYQIEMGAWHEPNGKCSVCLAGAVMAQSLYGERSKAFIPSDFGPNELKLRALDDFRCGYINEAFMQLGMKHPGLPEYFEVAQYRGNPQKFKKNMRQLATLLAKEGL